MHFKEINPNLIWTNEGFGNTIAINIGGKIFVIDSTKDWKLATEWRETIERHFNESVSGLILTHHHEDHTFGNQVFSDLPIIASSRIREIMIELQKKYWILDDMIEWEDEGYGIRGLKITFPNICFDNRLTIHGERSLDIIRADGHTLGSSYLWEKETRTLIAGDLIFNKQFPYGADETSDLIKWKEVLDEISKLKPKIIVPGHGPPVTDKDLKEIRDFFTDTVNFMKKKVITEVKLEEIIEDPKFPDYYSKDRTERKKVSIETWYEYFQKK
ncbi:MAG: MBL fold metallo-hydrolase [Candidatus Hodarchaeales archaeon]|jgi:glyoxylase-like metal-dependent hydrolase (beta-lactamase superfamily II)